MSYDSPQHNGSTGEDTPEHELYQKYSSSDSYEFDSKIAEEIHRSIDLSMEFWGNVRDTSGMIPAYRLKCVLRKPNRSSEIAQTTWARMAQDDIEILKNVQGILMQNGEIEIDKLFEALEKTSQRVGISFQDMFPECYNEDIIASAVDVMNELLYLLNQNEPPEIDDDDVLFPAFNQTGSMFISIKQDEKTCQRSIPIEEEEVIISKIEKVLDKARKLGIDNIKVPSSPHISEQSKLQVVEKQVKAKMRLKRVNAKILSHNSASFKNNQENPSITEESAIHNIRREINKQHRVDNAKNKPTFKASVKTRPLDFNATFKNAPNLQKRMKSRRKVFEAQLNSNNFKTTNARSSREVEIGHLKNFNENLPKRKYIKQSTNLNTIKNVDICSSIPFRRPNLIKPSQYESKIINERKIQKRSTINENNDNIECENTIGSYSSSKEDTMLIPENEKVSDQKEKLNNREEMLNEMKKMLKEALKVVGTQNPVNKKSTRPDIDHESKEEDLPSKCFLTAFCQTSQQDVLLDKDINNANSIELINGEKPDQEMKVDIQRLLNEDVDTLDIKVTQESISPLLWPLAREQERTVTTEISVSQLNPGPAVKLSVVNYVRSEEEGLCKLAMEQPERVQEAVCYLNELLDTNSTQGQALELPKEDLSLEKESDQKSITASNMNCSIETSNDKEPSQTSAMINSLSESSKNQISTNEPLKDLDGLNEETVMVEEASVSQGSLKSENGNYGDLPTVNVNMAFMMEDCKFGYTRDDPRACTLFQMMIGQEPPRILEEIGDVGSGHWIDPWTWQKNFSDPPTTDSMDSLYVNVEQIHNISVEELHSDHDNQITSSKINEEKESQIVSTEGELSKCEKGEDASIKAFEASGVPTGPTTDIKRSDESQPTVANPTIFPQQVDNQITTDSSHSPDDKTISTNSGQTEMTVSIVKLLHLIPSTIGRSVLHIVGAFFAKIYLWPITYPYNYIKQIWSSIFRKNSTEKGKLTGSSAPLESPD